MNRKHCTTLTMLLMGGCVTPAAIGRTSDTDTDASSSDTSTSDASSSDASSSTTVPTDDDTGVELMCQSASVGAGIAYVGEPEPGVWCDDELCELACDFRFV